MALSPADIMYVAVNRFSNGQISAVRGGFKNCCDAHAEAAGNTGTYSGPAEVYEVTRGEWVRWAQGRHDRAPGILATCTGTCGQEPAPAPEKEKEPGTVIQMKGKAAVMYVAVNYAAAGHRARTRHGFETCCKARAEVNSLADVYGGPTEVYEMTLAEWDRWIAADADELPGRRVSCTRACTKPAAA